VLKRQAVEGSTELRGRVVETKGPGPTKSKGVFIVKVNFVRLAFGALMLACTLGAFVFPPRAQAQTVTTLFNFYCAIAKGNCADGAEPTASLMQATNGYLYGIAQAGGDYPSVFFNGPFGGTIFNLTANGSFSQVYSFCAADAECPHGYGPIGSLVQATNGALYGFTFAYGGTVYRITPSGTLTSLHTFGGGSDGLTPVGAMVQAVDGYLYGTTKYGGGSAFGGTIFKLTPSGTLSILYTFCAHTGCTDGMWPLAGLVQATDAALYGTTSAGGAYNSGTVFKITTSGKLTTLYSFCAQSGCPDGKAPAGGLIQAANGDLYGTTSAGGAFDNAGTVFKITTSGTLTTLYSFCAKTGCTDGFTPFATLAQATDGNLYGTTTEGGAFLTGGTMFQITPGGTLTTLYSFCAENGCPDGEKALPGLVQSTDGDLYGATLGGGLYRAGTLFRLSMGLKPFVATLPTVGVAGGFITVFGSDLRGTTGVTFNGAAATFTQASATAVKAIVPAGATTGTVVVTTPGGSLSSNVAFRVVQ